MGFDFRKAISRFSSKCQTQVEHKGAKMVGLGDSAPVVSIAPKRDKISIPSRKSREKITHFTPPRKSREKSRRRDGKTGTKSVKFEDCKCSRSVKISPLGPPTSTNSTKSQSLSLSLSTSDSRRRDVETSFSSLTTIEEPLKPPASENPTKPQARLPQPIGVHSRNLSYGTIYNAAKSSKPRDEAPCPEDVRRNTPENSDKKDGDRLRELKRSGSMRLAFGLGGCNYGHGSVVNGVKTLKKGRDCAAIVEDVIMGKKGACVDVEELKNAGNREYKKGLFENAISFYNKAIAMDPKNASCHHNKAAALTLLGRIKEAVEECLEAANCNPSYVRAHYRLGNLYTRLGQVEDAKKHFKLSGHSRGSEAVQRMIAIEANMKRMREAMQAEDWDRVLVECSRAMVAGADASDEVVAAKAEALLKLKRANEALELLEGANGASGTSCVKFLLLKVELYFFLGRFEEAAQAAEEAIYLEFNKNSLTQLKKAWGAADAHRAGNEYFKAGKYSDAYAMYTHALQYLPSNPALLSRRASSMFKLGQWERAIEDCNFALESCPGHSEATVQRAQAHAKLGRWEEAQRDYLLIGKPSQTLSKPTVSKPAQLGLRGCRKISS